MNIGDAWDPFWGHVVSVIANEVRNFGLGTGFVPHINNDSKTFIFPDKEEIIQPLIQICNKREIWNPSEDFTIDSRRMGNGSNVEMYFHTTLFDTVAGGELKHNYDVTLNRGYSSQIKNFEKKISEIWEQYLEETDREDGVRFYVENISRVELLKYLFEIDYLSEDDLTICGMRNDEFERFINRLEELEDEYFND